MLSSEIAVLQHTQQRSVSWDKQRLFSRIPLLLCTPVYLFYYTTTTFCSTGNCPVLSASHNTEPTFRIVQGKSKRFVLVLDVSGSMNTKTHGVSKHSLQFNVFTANILKHGRADSMFNMSVNCLVGPVYFLASSHLYWEFTSVLFVLTSEDSAGGWRGGRQIMTIIHTGSLNTLTVILAKSTGNSGNQSTLYILISFLG